MTFTGALVSPIIQAFIFSQTNSLLLFPPPCILPLASRRGPGALTNRPNAATVACPVKGAMWPRNRQNLAGGASPSAVRVGELKTTQVAGCPGLKTPARVVFYQARAGAVGTDHLVYAITNPTSAVATYDVTINIKEAPKDAKPSGGSKI